MMRTKVFSFAATPESIAEHEKLMDDWRKTVNAKPPAVATTTGTNEYGHAFVNITLVFQYENHVSGLPMDGGLGQSGQ